MYWKPTRSGSTWTTPKGGFDLFARTKVYRSNKVDGGFTQHSFYQRGEVVYRDVSGGHRVYNVSLLHDAKGKPFVEGTLYDCDKCYLPEYALNGQKYTYDKPNLYQSAGNDLVRRGVLVRFDKSKMKWVDERGIHVPKCKMLLFDDDIVEDSSSWHWEEKIYAY
tara:strand:- start:3409 stop:3900 length:492 start_codon:yes stop_codon:yes gene_type:complete